MKRPGGSVREEGGSDGASPSMPSLSDNGKIPGAASPSAASVSWLGGAAPSAPQGMKRPGGSVREEGGSDGASPSMPSLSDTGRIAGAASPSAASVSWLGGDAPSAPQGMERPGGSVREEGGSDGASPSMPSLSDNGRIAGAASPSAASVSWLGGAAPSAPQGMKRPGGSVREEGGSDGASPSMPSLSDTGKIPGAPLGPWVESLRGPRPALDPGHPAGWQVELEPSADGSSAPVLTVFLTNRECPWRCVFCDLWQHALPSDVPGVAPGDIPRQIETALAAVARAGPPVPRQIKLYNAGSFFDRNAIPPGDHPAIADAVRGFERVIVECHPALVGDGVRRFADELARARGGGPAALEVAMGLETVNPAVLPRLNKGITAGSFARAARRLRREGVDLRVFVLVQPPFEAPGEAVTWARRSAAFAFDQGASVVSLIPVRPGNGALDALRAAGRFEPPTLATFEEAVDAALAVAPGGARVFGDLWDLERFGGCAECFPRRRERLERINYRQQSEPAIPCPRCRGETGAALGHPEALNAER
jgi:radical SAM enzyme (TIGR01210 family)